MSRNRYCIYELEKYLVVGSSFFEAFSHLQMLVNARRGELTDVYHLVLQRMRIANRGDGGCGRRVL